jgi:NIMA (never in mitosis gene a)-related kinase
MHIKIGDFGVAKKLKNHIDFSETMIGTPFYISPEISLKQKYDFKSDIWALGCVLYELCQRRVPFKSSNNKILLNKIQKGNDSILN